MGVYILVLDIHADAASKVHRYTEIGRSEDEVCIDNNGGIIGTIAKDRCEDNPCKTCDNISNTIHGNKQPGNVYRVKTS